MAQSIFILVLNTMLHAKIHDKW